MSNLSALKAKLKRLETERRRADDEDARLARMSTPELRELLLSGCEAEGFQGLTAETASLCRDVLRDLASESTSLRDRERARTLLAQLEATLGG